MGGMGVLVTGTAVAVGNGCRVLVAVGGGNVAVVVAVLVSVGRGVLVCVGVAVAVAVAVAVLVAVGKGDGAAVGVAAAVGSAVGAGEGTEAISVKFAVGTRVGRIFVCGEGGVQETAVTITTPKKITSNLIFTETNQARLTLLAAGSFISAYNLRKLARCKSDTSPFNGIRDLPHFSMSRLSSADSGLPAATISPTAS